MSGSDTAPQGEPSTGQYNLTTLLQNVNTSSTSARIGWVSFLALSAVLFVILSSVKDYNLLLDTPVVIPLINLSVPLHIFFLVMPGVYIFTHFSILLQNVLLAQKVEIFDTNTTNLEELNSIPVHPIRFQLNTYFMTQVIAGPTRHKSMGRYLDDISWISLTVLPQVILIYFLLAYLPYHDIFTTWVHRFYILLDILVLTTISTYFTAPLLSFSGALWDTVKYYPFRTLFSTLLVGAGLFFSFAIATIPGEMIERRLLPLNALAPSFINTTEDSFFLTSLVFGDKNATKEKQRTSLFRRNLVLTDHNINELQKVQNGESRINLRERDLRYAIFNRSNVTGADFSRAQLQGASFYNATLDKGKFNHANLDGARFINTGLNGTQYYKAKIFGTNFTRSSLKGASFRRAGVIGSNLSSARLAGASFNDAKLHGSHFYKADLRAATFINSALIGVSFSGANLLAADMRRGIVWESVTSGKNRLLDLGKRKLLPPTKQDKAWVLKGLRQIQDASLRKKLVTSLSPVFKKSSAANWPRGLDYPQWRELLARARASRTTNFNNRLSVRLANMSCTETDPAAHLATAIVRRVTSTYLQQPLYNGNPESYLRKVLSGACPAFANVPPGLRQQLYDSVLQGRSISSLLPKKVVQPAPEPARVEETTETTETPE